MEVYILTNQVKEGPYSIEELASKNITPNTMVWAVGFSDWKPAKEVSELANLLSSIPPEPQAINKPPMPKTWFVESILVTCICCLPFGIAGIVNATKIESLYYNGEYDRALYHSKEARKWTLWGFFTMLIFGGLYCLALFGIFLIGMLS